MNRVYLQYAYGCVLDTYFYFSDRVLYTALGYRVCIYCMYILYVYTIWIYCMYILYVYAVRIYCMYIVRVCIHDTGVSYIWTYFSLISKFLFIWLSTIYLVGLPPECVFFISSWWGYHQNICFLLCVGGVPTSICSQNQNFDGNPAIYMYDRDSSFFLSIFVMGRL